MFAEFKKFAVVLVTGPQRSGTRIAARCITADTGYRYIDERDFFIHDEGAFTQIVDTARAAVVHCPAMCHIVHKFGARDDVLVVMVIRELYEIAASQQRINWQGNSRELGKYKLSTGDAATVKYAYWLTHQRKSIKNWRELQYAALAKHRLWIPPEQRADFKADQWKI